MHSFVVPLALRGPELCFPHHLQSNSDQYKAEKIMESVDQWENTGMVEKIPLSLLLLTCKSHNLKMSVSLLSIGFWNSYFSHKIVKWDNISENALKTIGYHIGIKECYYYDTSML